jgi:lactobin A/cerein 7B family class IIb bacteriocin
MTKSAKRELSLGGEIHELSMDDLDQVAGGLGPLAVLAVAAGAAVVAAAGAAIIGAYIGVKVYEATSGNTMSLTINKAGSDR